MYIYIYIFIIHIRISGPYLGQTASGRRVGAQNGKRPNRDM